MMKKLFIDTNIFIHYQFSTKIDWCKLTKSDNIIIVIPPIIIRELNKLKDTSRQKFIRERAQKVLKEISRMLENETNSHINPSVKIQLEDRDSNIDYNASNLDFRVHDDQLMASILMNKNESPDIGIILVTADLGLILISKAKRFGIENYKLPTEYLRPNRIDDEEKKIRSLEREVHDLKTRIPKLGLGFINGQSYSAFNLPKPSILKDEKISEEIEHQRNEYPKKHKNEKGELRDVDSRLATAFLTRKFLDIPDEEYDRYNSEVDDYLEKYKQYLINYNRIENSKRRIIKLELHVTNDGTAPASDIDIFLHFPDGFKLVLENDLFRYPIAPKAPLEPMNDMRKLAYSINYPNIPSLGRSDFGYTLESIPNVSKPEIKKTNSFDVHIHIDRIKHNLFEKLDSLFVIFGDYKSVKSFGFEYRLLAENIPKQIIGTLNVVIEKSVK